MTGGEEVPHTSELLRWDQAYPESAAADPQADLQDALKELIAAAVRAAVVAPERELRRWFSWQWYWTDSLVNDLVRDGRLRRIAGHVAVLDSP